MELAMVGLGRMGANMAERLIKGGHQVIGHDLNAQAVEALVEEINLIPAFSLEAVVKKLSPPRTIWTMVPAGGPVQSVMDALSELLDPGDLIVDGGNSNYQDSMGRAVALAEKGIQFVDVGTSGGIWGLAQGYSMMVGGEKEAVARLRPALETLAPAPDRGWGHVGPSGAGHFVKMIHNGIEYGLMQAYAEGFEIMYKKEVFDLDLHQIAEIWRYGSVVRSWLLDLAAAVLAEDHSLSDVAGYVPDSGEGRWTVAEAIDLDIPAPVITSALMFRFVSRQDESYAARLLAVLRNQFGGHAIREAE
ncbi:MAG TPA: decarboxylating 6-phosphogluconate dehydrogenase [Anaerolineae bacterium]